MKIIISAWKGWLRIAKVIGEFQAQVLLSIFYLLIFSVMGVTTRIFFDPLRLKLKKKSNFETWDLGSEDLKQSKLQY